MSAAPTTLYTNAALPAARSPSTPSRPPSGSNSGHRNKNKNNNKNRHGGHGGGNNGRNNNDSGGCNSSSGQTTAPTASDGRTGTPWLTYGHPWHGHMTIYPARCPQDSSVRMPSWPHRAPIYHLGSYPTSSSSRFTSRPLPFPHQAGTPGSARAGTSNRWPTHSTP
jgi:hypothetical protein